MTEINMKFTAFINKINQHCFKSNKWLDSGVREPTQECSSAIQRLWWYLVRPNCSVFLHVFLLNRTWYKHLLRCYDFCWQIKVTDYKYDAYSQSWFFFEFYYASELGRTNRVTAIEYYFCMPILLNIQVLLVLYYLQNIF